MYSFLRSTNFERRYRKLTKHNSFLKEAVGYALTQMADNPFSSKLKTHKVISSLTRRQTYSSKVYGDLRIIWDFNQDEINIIDLLDLGGHSGNNKVYN